MFAWIKSLLRPAPTEAAAVLPPAKPIVTPDLLEKMGVLPRLSVTWAPVVDEACRESGITTRMNVACFLANVLHETGNLTVLRENLNYTPDGLARTWPSRFMHGGAPSAKALALGRIGTKPANQAGIAEAVYGGRGGNRPEGSGDGWTFIGRGLLQITFHDGYAAVAQAFGKNILDVPAWLETPEGAARASANWWARHGLNRYGAAGDITSCRKLVNAGTLNIQDSRVNGLSEARQKFARLIQIIPE